VEQLKQVENDRPLVAVRIVCLSSGIEFILYAKARPSLIVRPEVRLVKERSRIGALATPA
jgi:hypothetical protein